MEETIVSRELSRMLGALSHPFRIRLVEALGVREIDVSHLQELLGASQPLVSQHLSVLRAARLVSERREGRHVLYRLCRPELCRWMLEGLDFVGWNAEDRRQLVAAAVNRELSER